MSLEPRALDVTSKAQTLGFMFVHWSYCVPLPGPIRGSRTNAPCFNDLRLLAEVERAMVCGFEWFDRPVDEVNVILLIQ